jgi:hypothetical protein
VGRLKLWQRDGPVTISVHQGEDHPHHHALPHHALPHHAADHHAVPHHASLPHHAATLPVRCLEAMVDGGKVKATLPTALDSEHQKLLDDLKAKNGKEFDQTYDQVQVKAHRDAVALFEAYGKSGDNADLKNWASQTLPHLKEHLSMAEKLK